MFSDEHIDLAVESHYYKAWCLVVLWTCVGASDEEHKSGLSLAQAAEQYPTLRMFLFMLITK